MRKCNRKPRPIIVYGGTVERINAGVDPGDGIEFSIDSKKNLIIMDEVIDFDFRVDFARIGAADARRLAEWFSLAADWMEKARR